MNADDISFEELGYERYDSDADVPDMNDSSTSNMFKSVTITTVPTGTVSTAGATFNGSASGGATYNVYGSSSSPKIVHTFDLAEMGVMQVGTFDSQGMMLGWVVATNTLPVQYPAFMATQHVISLMAGPNYEVMIRGVYSKYFTNERRAAMGLPAI